MEEEGRPGAGRRHRRRNANNSLREEASGDISVCEDSVISNNWSRVSCHFNYSNSFNMHIQDVSPVHTVPLRDNLKAPVSASFVFNYTLCCADILTFFYFIYLPAEQTVAGPPLTTFISDVRCMILSTCHTLGFFFLLLWCRKPGRPEQSGLGSVETG